MSPLTQLSLLVTDLDNTLIGNDESLSQLLQLLDRFRQTDNTKIVYVTGRSPESYQQLANTVNLLTPDAFISSVGTEIYLGDSLTQNLDWVDNLSYNWQRDEILAISNQFADLEPQPQSEQRPFKIVTTFQLASSLQLCHNYSSYSHSNVWM